MRHRVVKFGIVILLAIIVISGISLTYLNTNAKAADPVNIELLKQNVFYKSVYSNLEKCYGEMKSPIEESSDNTWAAYDSDTYFSSNALAKTFLKFPSNVVNKHMSSCPEMIKGWHEHWIKNIFTNRGSYDGLLAINKDAEVPDWDNSSTDKMSKFLKDLGYSLTTSGAENVGDRKCFYLKLSFSSGAMNYTWLPEPAAGGYTVETPDYCVSLGSNNTFDPGEDILVLSGNNDYFSSEYDNGHLTDTSNVIWPFFKNGLNPQWRHHNTKDPEDHYLVATWDYIEVRYPYNTEYGTDLYATTLFPKKATKKQNFTQEGGYDQYCFNLGYVECGWKNGGGWFESDWVFSSIAYKNENLSYDTLKNRLKEIFSKAVTEDGEYLFDSVFPVDYTPQKRSYTKGTSTSKYLNYFLKDVSKFDSGTFTDAEKYILYWTYLKDDYNVSTHDSAIDNGVLVSWLQDDGTFKQTYIYDPDENLNDKKYVLSNNKWDGTTTQDWHWIAEQLAAIDVEKAFGAEVESILDPGLSVDPGEDPGINSQQSEPSCYDQAGSLGWILCPIIDSLADFVLKVYAEWVEPALRINTTLFDTSNAQFKLADGSSVNGTYHAWSMFRNIANIAFIIMFIVVIFSQLTGVGIDNYGIKKILPKLIIGAILINLSYVICELMIDIANIVGKGIGGLFQSLSRSLGTIDAVEVNGTTVGSGSWHGSFFSSAWNPVICIVVAVFGAVLVLSKGLAIIIPALMLMISAAFSLFALIAILGVRQALAVILVVASPLAFVCYMLPNTKSIFDKWFNMFKGLLVAYPICSALIYGGDMVGNILLHAANGQTWILISAAVISIAPIFFIPKVITASLGTISQGMMRMSGNIGRRASGAFGHSGFAMDMNRRAQMQKAGIKFDKNGNASYTKWGKIQNKLPRTRGSKQRLDMARRQAALSQAQMGNVGQFTGTAGLKKMTNMQVSANAGRAAQDVQDEISAMSSEYATEGQMIDDLYKYSGMTSMTEGEQLRYQALMTKLSGSSQGKKALANVARGGTLTKSDGKTQVKVSDVGRDQLASYATNGDGSVLSAINDKDAFAATYIESVAAQNAANAKAVAQGGAATTVSDFATWGAQKDSKGRSNIQAVTEDRLDDNLKLMAQSGDARNDAFTATDASGRFVVSDERINAIDGDKDMQAQYADKIQDIYNKSGRNPVTSSETHEIPGTGDELVIQHHRDGSEVVTDKDGNQMQGPGIDPNKYKVVSTESYSLHGGRPVEVSKMADGRYIRKSDGVDITNDIGRYKKI